MESPETVTADDVNNAKDFVNLNKNDVKEENSQKFINKVENSPGFINANDVSEKNSQDCVNINNVEEEEITESAGSDVESVDLSDDSDEITVESRLDE